MTDTEAQERQARALEAIAADLHAAIELAVEERRRNDEPRPPMPTRVRPLAEMAADVRLVLDVARLIDPEVKTAVDAARVVREWDAVLNASAGD